MKKEKDKIRCKKIERIGERSCKVEWKLIMKWRVKGERRKKRIWDEREKIEKKELRKKGIKKEEIEEGEKRKLRIDMDM